MKTFTAFSLILLSTSTYVNALPADLPVGNSTVPLIRLEETGAYLNGAANASRARARLLKSRTPVGPYTMPMFSSGSHFTAKVGVGNSDPVKYYHLLVDTGSPITWIHTGHDFCGISSKGYTETDTSELTGQRVSMAYGRPGTREFQGSQYLDKVTLTPELVITHQSIGSISPDSIGLDTFKFQGILGLGPVSRSRGSLDPNTNALVPTVMNNLKSKGVIAEEVFSVYISPLIGPGTTEGKLIFGDPDPDLHKGELTYIPLTNTNPASQYWGIDLSSCTYDSHTIIETPIAGFVDSGAPTILIPNNFFQVYVDAIPGAKFDTKIGLIEIPTYSAERMQPIHFKFGDHTFTLDGNSQLLPQSRNKNWGGDAGKHYGFVRPIGHAAGHGIDFVLGRPFLEKYYTVYDAERKQIGFAPAYVLV
ncbi:Aspartic peptidase domain containing protein [Tylopilus felleus]